MRERCEGAAEGVHCAAEDRCVQTSKRDTGDPSSAHPLPPPTPPPLRPPPDPQPAQSSKYTRPTTVVLIVACTCTRCADCGGSAMCVHGHRLVRCKHPRCRKKAGDRSELCIHNKTQSRCRDCQTQGAPAPVLFKEPLRRVVSLKIHSRLGLDTAETVL